MDNLIDKINNSNLPLIHGLGKLIFYDEDLDKIIIDRCDE